MSVLPVFAVLCIYCLQQVTLQTPQVSIKVDVEKVIQDIDEDVFMGVTLDCYLMQDNWEGFDFRNGRMLNLAKGIGPSFLRIGGTACDSLTFDPNRLGKKHVSKLVRPPFTTNFTMTAEDWDNFNMFVKKVGWKMIFGINAKKRDGAEWDPLNALVLLKYTADKGYPIYGFELGNEPDIFPKSVSPEQLGDDFAVLQRELESLPFGKSLIIGPDTTGVGQYVDDFLKGDGGGVINAATVHHYYFDGRHSVLSMFMDTSIMDSLKSKIESFLSMGNARIPGKPVWLGETSSAYNTGTPGISNSYVAGFLWMDKLGLSAKMGVKAVLRQDFYGGNYSLVQQNTFYPNPDYWLTVLYKRLVGSHVFNLTSTADKSVRVYAHCAKQTSVYKYGAGSVVVYAMNLHTSDVTLTVPQFAGQTRDVYWLTSPNNNLTATTVDLNGAPINLVNDDLPPLTPSKLSTDVTMPPTSFGFLVFPEAGVSACTSK
ncbi:hyaluronoglucuronidase-like isoform X2 [Haliotis rufescens]|uniref:hyaluronoglucuronidase-like isoform X2 n=1 Tax=Haliotis rufescens TaxID=6454 RepID=UPI001EB0315A|nr:hyaluronoglucuronidase-like isoform X2 [Haliotis rufescens]